MMLTSAGTLRYSLGGSGYRLVAEVDPGIADFYRALVPKSVRLNRQKYAPHITVVRQEVPLNTAAWGKYEGTLVEFTYRSFVYHDHLYYWLGAFAPRLEEIRRELGLPGTSWVTESPDASSPFHITIGNTKPGV